LIVNYTPINFAEKLGLIRDQWQPRVVAEMNDYQSGSNGGTVRALAVARATAVARQRQRCALR
jgi:hypothetical protein